VRRKEISAAKPRGFQVERWLGIGTAKGGISPLPYSEPNSMCHFYDYTIEFWAQESAMAI